MHLIEVKNLARAEIGTKEVYDFETDGKEFDFPEIMNVGKIKGKVTLIQLDESVVVKGEMTAEVQLICDRCLDNFDTEQKFTFEREYLYDRKTKSEENLFIDKNLNVDLTEPIHDELLLAIPTQNFCQAECKGLCAGCGHNLNRDKCTCKMK
jgi:uncharacterized protein